MCVCLCLYCDVLAKTFIAPKVISTFCLKFFFSTVPCPPTCLGSMVHDFNKYFANLLNLCSSVFLSHFCSKTSIPEEHKYLLFQCQVLVQKVEWTDSTSIPIQLQTGLSTAQQVSCIYLANLFHHSICFQTFSVFFCFLYLVMLNQR